MTTAVVHIVGQSLKVGFTFKIVLAGLPNSHYTYGLLHTIVVFL